MNEREIKAKLEQERKLSEEELAWLDEQLAESKCTLLNELPQEEMPLVWRSALNERLAAMQPRPKPRWLWLGSAASVGAACALGWMLLTPGRTTTPAGSGLSLEEELVSTHESLVRQASANLAIQTTQTKVDTEVLQWAEDPSDSL